jgi:hypothetical protein
VPSTWRAITVIVSGLLLVATSACAGGTATTVSAPTVQRRAVVVAASPAASPIVVNAGSGHPDPKPAASAAGGPSAALKLPADGQQVVMVESTDGQGVWVRRQPAGEPLRVWPDGSPMLVVGDDALAGGRTWRNVTTLDGQTGWVAAEFVATVDPAVLVASMPSLNDLLHASASAPGGVPRDVQARVVVGEGTRTADQSGAPAAAPPPPPPTAVAATPKPAAAFVGQRAPGTNAAVTAGATATSQPTATPLPTATPIKAPAGATSIDAGPVTMAVSGVDRGIPLEIGARPRTGMELLAIQVQVKNRGDQPFALYRGSFRLALSDRTRVEPLAGGNAPLPYSAEIAPGAALDGSLVFEVPTGTRVDALVWAPERDIAYSLGVQP